MKTTLPSGSAVGWARWAVFHLVHLLMYAAIRGEFDRITLHTILCALLLI